MKRLFAIPTILITILLAIIIPLKVQAASSLPFSVQPIIPTQQRDKSESYIDVVVAPNKSAQIQVKLTNNTDKDVKVNVTIHSAQTSDSGVIDYGENYKKDSTLKYDLSDHLKGPKTVIVPASGELTYTANLQMPSDKLPGIMAGGLIFSPVTGSGAESSNSGMAIVNKYSYDISVLTRNENTTWLPELKISNAKINQLNYKNYISIPMHNVSATFLNQLRVETTAENTKTRKKYHRTQSKMQMAPNSHFSYRIQLPNSADAGSYQVKTTAYYVKDTNGKYTASDGTKYQYKLKQNSKVTVTAKKAKALKEKIQDAKGGMPWFVYAVIVGFVVLVGIIAMLGYLLLINHRSNTK